ncbi:MAG TPA: UDP-glucose/GDP-mannose dehydrogenase family protein [Bauldia sp.]|nr:UDP-glucose/GDP-mannose dehydrogenase family protein [Bauldia sp.]
MKIAILGAGYVGLVSGACLADFGHQVVCIEKDAERVRNLRAGKIPIYEPGLAAIVAANLETGNLTFDTEVNAVRDREVVFIAVGTPTQRGGARADLSQVFQAADEIASAIAEGTVVVCKSTVPVGTTRAVGERIRKARPALRFEVASNPEFLREGSAIEDFKRPDRIIVGVESEAAREALYEVYRPLSLNETPLLFTGLETAELTKYAANAFLATKITFINEIADLCERVGANVQDVARGMGMDRRIGPKFLHAGAGYGGSCFPKDTLALVETGRDAGTVLSIVESVIAANDARKAGWAGRIVSALGGSAKGRTIAVLGLTFKPNTDDMREAPSLAIIPALQEHGASVRVHDPKGMPNAKALISDVTWCDTPLEAVKGADCVVLTTEWEVYRAMDLDQLKSSMRGDLFFDLRNVYRPWEAQRAGLRYFGVGLGDGPYTAPPEIDDRPSERAPHVRLVSGG